MSHRLLKVNEAVRETLSAAIPELTDPRVGFVTVTGVETSGDLRHARVYVSVLGGERERLRTLDGLQSSHGFLQERIAAAVRLKRTPQLQFVYDDSIDRGMRMEHLLTRLESGSGDVGGRDTPAADEDESEETAGEKS